MSLLRNVTTRVLTRVVGKSLPRCKPGRAYNSMDRLTEYLTLKRQYTRSSSKVFYPRQKLMDRESLGTAVDTMASRLTSVKLNAANGQLSITWSDGESQAYPFVWLRDNCRCQKCFNSDLLFRLTTSDGLDVDVAVESADISSDPGDGEGQTLIATWEDGHVSEYPASWLWEYRFDESPDDPFLKEKHRFWGSDHTLKSFKFQDLLEDDRELYGWLLEMKAAAIALIKETPCEVGQLERLGKRVSLLRATNYGKTFQVQAKEKPSSAAYTPRTLGLHTDLTYYMRSPEIQMLHCIKQTESAGGENMFADGFKVAADLKRDDPEAFRLLTTYKFDSFDFGTDYFGEFFQYSSHPVIGLNDEGEFETITFNDRNRDPMLRVPVGQVTPLYRALHKYTNMLKSPENQLRYRMDEGDILTFGNGRTLHARTSFQLTSGSWRHLEGGYLEWDEVNSRLRVLSKKLGAY